MEEQDEQQGAPEDMVLEARCRKIRVGVAATTLNANNAAAAKRVPNPVTSRTGNPSSAQVPITAATAGGSRGTWYSLRNSAR